MKVNRELPDGWKWERLGDVVTNHDKQRVPLKESERSGKKGIYPYCGANGVIDYIDEFIFDGKYILLAEDGGYWKNGEKSAYIMSGKFWANNHVHILTAKDGISTNGFLCKILNWMNLEKYISGSTRGKLTLGNLNEILIMIPPLEIQHKIVEILDSMEEIKCLRDDADSIPNQMIHSAFLEMFGDPIKNSRGWNLYKLGELGSWTSGGTPSRSKPEYFQGDIPWFTAGELNDSYIWDSKEKITKEALNSSSAKLFPAETMLIGMYDTAAFKMGVLKNPASSNQACAAFFPKAEVINTLFALYLFKEMKNYFLSKRRGIRQKNLSQKIIKNFEVPVPPIDLQQKFAYFVQSIEEIKYTQENSTLIIDDMFNQVLDKAFKGELVC